MRVSTDRLADIRRAGGGEATFDLELPEGPVTALFGTVVENADGGYSLGGKIRSAPLGRVLLTVQDKAVVADISVRPSVEFMVLPAASAGEHELRRLNRAVLPICDGYEEPALVADAATGPSDEKLVAQGEEDGEGLAHDFAGTGSQGGGAETGPGTGQAPVDTTIDVLILYSPECIARVNGQAPLMAFMNQAIADANLTYQACGISCALRLVHHQQVTFASSKMALDMLKLKNPGDGVVDEAPVLRDQYAADVVSLWHDYTKDSAGIAFLVKNGVVAKTSAYNIVDVDYAVTARSFVHEIGHNMGLNHDAGNASGQGATLSSYGYRFTGNSGTVRTTIMAYPPGERVPYFSSPNHFFDGVAMGTSAANNTDAAVRSKDWLSAARVPVPPVVTQQPTANSAITSGGFVILSVTASGTPPVYQWLSGPAGGELTPIQGANEPNYTASPTATTQYQCVVQNGAGTVYSDNVSVQVN